MLFLTGVTELMIVIAYKRIHSCPIMFFCPLVSIIPFTVQTNPKGKFTGDVRETWTKLQMNKSARDLDKAIKRLHLHVQEIVAHRSSPVSYFMYFP